VIPTSTTLVAYEGDTTPPTLTFGDPTPAPNAAGWNNTAVDVPFTTADDLSGVQSSAPASPLHFTAEGINQTQQVTVTDKVGNSATFTSPAINIDLTAPSTSIQIPGVSQQQEWFTGPVQVTLSTADNLSGVASTFYRINFGGPQTYASPFTISADGNYTIEYWSVDVAGNSETHQTRTVRIDSTGPVTEAILSGLLGTNGWYRTPVQISLSATDNLSGVQTTFYSIGVPSQTYTGPFSVTGEGQHIISYSSVDNVGNFEPNHLLFLKIDTAAPTVSATATPSTFPKGPKPITVIVSGNVSDAVSGVSGASYSVIDEYGVAQPSGPVMLQVTGDYNFAISLPATKPGSDKNGHLYTIIITATDQAGNSAQAITTVTIN